MSPPDGFVMFATGKIADDDVSGRTHIDDCLDIGQDLNPKHRYPAFMVWEGMVRFTSDDFYTNGKWRSATAAEIIAASQGCSPFGS